jgi:hypothetical protein
MDTILLVLLPAIVSGIAIRFACAPGQGARLLSGALTAVLGYSWDMIQLGYFDPFAILYFPILLGAGYLTAALFQKRSTTEG